MARKWYHKLSPCVSAVNTRNAKDYYPPFGDQIIVFYGSGFLVETQAITRSPNVPNYEILGGQHLSILWKKEKIFQLPKGKSLLSVTPGHLIDIYYTARRTKKVLVTETLLMVTKSENFGASSLHGYFSWELSPEVWWLFKEDWYHNCILNSCYIWKRPRPFWYFVLVRLSCCVSLTCTLWWDFCFKEQLKFYLQMCLVGKRFSSYWEWGLWQCHAHKW